jgi:hypothetical protein
MGKHCTAVAQNMFLFCIFRGAIQFEGLQAAILKLNQGCGNSIHVQQASLYISEARNPYYKATTTKTAGLGC